mgnify:CR=1 FL=1
MMNRSEYDISPLQRIYNIEKTLFPELEKIKGDIDNFEKVLAEIYSEIDNRDGWADIMKGWLLWTKNIQFPMTHLFIQT